MFEAIEREVERVGLKINENKTKFMIIFRSQRRTIITSDTFESVKIKRRIAKANKAYFNLARLLKSKELTRAFKMKIYKTLIKPI